MFQCGMAGARHACRYVERRMFSTREGRRLERSGRDDHAVFVDINPVAWTERHPGEPHRHVALAFAALLAAQRDRAERADAEVQASELCGIAEASMDHD